MGGLANGYARTGVVLLFLSAVAAVGFPSVWAYGHVTSVATIFQEKELKVFAKAQSETQGAFLSLNETDASVPQYRPPEFSALHSGTVAFANANTGGPGDSFHVPLAGRLPRTYFLNVSKSITGQVWFAWSGSATTLEEALLKVEVCSSADGQCAGTRLGADSRTYCAGLGCSSTAQWNRMSFSARPEALNLSEGSSLSLKITRYGSLADFVLGTGGDHASFVRFAYYDADPLSVPSYATRGRIYFGTPPPETTSPPPKEGSDGVRTASAAAAALLAMAAWTPGVARARGRAWLLAVALLAVGLAGCFNQGSPRDAPSTSSRGTDLQVTSTEEEREDLVAVGAGEIQGVVRDEELGFPVRDVAVSLLGTSQFAETDTNGTFRFTNLTPDTYTLRFTHAKYSIVELDVQVRAGFVHRVTLILPPLDASGRAHRHGDLWKAPSQLFFDSTTRLWMNAPGTPYTACYYLFRCESDFPINRKQPVLPGTVRLEVKLDWPDVPGAPRELGIWAQHPYQEDGQVSVGLEPRGRNDPFNIVFYPNWADPGHQEFTNWNFRVIREAFPGGYYYPFGDSQLVAGDIPVTAKIWGHKGVVPLEPRHTDYWGTKNEIVLFQNAETGVGSGVDTPTHANGWKVCDKAKTPPPCDAGRRVPPGTREIQGTLKWRTAEGGLVPVTPPNLESVAWALAYKGADKPIGNGELKHAKMGTPSNNQVDFTIPVDPLEADQFYQPFSYWTFHPDDQREALAAAAGNAWSTSTVPSGVTLTLTAKAVKDADWVDRGNR